MKKRFLSYLFPSLCYSFIIFLRCCIFAFILSLPFASCGIWNKNYIFYVDVSLQMYAVRIPCVSNDGREREKRMQHTLKCGWKWMECQKNWEKEKKSRRVRKESYKSEFRWDNIYAMLKSVLDLLYRMKMKFSHCSLDSNNKWRNALTKLNWRPLKHFTHFHHRLIAPSYILKSCTLFRLSKCCIIFSFESKIRTVFSCALFSFAIRSPNQIKREYSIMQGTNTAMPPIRCYVNLTNAIFILNIVQSTHTQCVLVTAFRFDDLLLLINIGIYDGMPDRYTFVWWILLRNRRTKNIFKMFCLSRPRSIPFQVCKCIDFPWAIRWDIKN